MSCSNPFQSNLCQVFDHLCIRRGFYALFHNDLQWHPNQEGYGMEQFLGGKQCIIDKLRDPWKDRPYYSFAEMRPILGPNIRIDRTTIYVAGESVYNPEHIEQMESLAHLWRDHTVCIRNAEQEGSPIVAEDFQPILNSPTILTCRYLNMNNALFSFNDYNVLYTVKVIQITYSNEYIDDDDQYTRSICIDSNSWPEFLEQRGFKPIVVLRGLSVESIQNQLDRISRAFSSAVLPNAFKIVFSRSRNDKPLTVFRKTNEASGDKLELKLEVPTECRYKGLNEDYTYTLECSSI
ncbi:hypothetical protein DdX_16963 [Ditylenchus destructor]|uniref:Uncharacterized protein n=1 Tax=Ditylenchus destructor TaxID=166010 RepID=A0AAD4MMI7_9BILA|nr:hypothetical protein DdX_16963 [Ditylenchus destructor]